jgi:hypothetical protein
MGFTLRLKTGSDMTITDADCVTVRKFEMLGTLPYTGGGDAFDYVASAANALVMQNFPNYMTPVGQTYVNSIQLHEEYYAQKYEISVTYGQINRQSGTYQITVDQAVGNVWVTAGVRIAGYGPDGQAAIDSGGTFWNGEEITGTEVPVPEDRLIISYRHPQAFLNRSYIKAIGTLRGYPNSDTFLGYAPGEVRYMGGQFTESEAEATAQYNFDVSPNVTGLVVAGITIAAKSGFDVVSPIYKHEVDDGGGEANAVKKIKYIEIIRPREHKPYKSVFGWG